MGMPLEASLWRALQEHNILPLTSRCNLDCLFCSHRQNPPGVKVYDLPERGAGEIRETFSRLDPRRKIIIGESATRFLEGEPFCYPWIREVLEDLRDFFPGTPLQVTTNGTLLDRPTVRWLGELGGVELVFSLNTVAGGPRERLLGDRQPGRVRETLQALGEGGVPFQGSVVALPHLLGWKDLEETVIDLGKAGASCIRVFLPGYTRLAPRELAFDLSLWDELHVFARQLAPALGVPLLVEPPLLGDLVARVEGVMAGTPAGVAGLRPGDIIRQVGGRPVGCREAAFQAALKEGDPAVVLERQGQVLARVLEKKEGQPPGFIMYRDLDPYRLEKFYRLLGHRREDRVLVLASALGHPLVEKIARDRWYGEGENLRVEPVPGLFFGGSIRCAGLLTTGDFISALQDVVPRLPSPPGLVVVPEGPFDYLGKDLRGVSYLEIQEKTGLPVTLA